MRTAFFDALDSTPFRLEHPEPLRARRAVDATGALMLHILVGDLAPVLAQAQAMDCAPLLRVLADQDDDTAAFLGLVRAGRIQVRLLTADTLLEAFCLALRSTFDFSAWPELTDPSLRGHLADQLTADPERFDRLIDDERLAARLAGLLELDAALRESAVVERARRSRAATLGPRVRDALVLLRDDAVPGTAAAFASLIEVTGQEPPHTRTAWYALIDELIPAGLPAHAQARGAVDAVYNLVVAESLGADGADVGAPDLLTASAVAAGDPTGRVGARVLKLGHDPQFDWLTWRRVPQHLESLREFRTRQHRLNRLVHDGVVQLETLYADQPVGRTISTWVLNNMGTLGGSVVGGLVGLVVPLPPAADIATTVAGPVVGSAIDRARRKLRVRELSQAKEAAEQMLAAETRSLLSIGSTVYPITN